MAVVCPHCGFKQLESVFAKSTICRKCSKPFPVGVPTPQEKLKEGEQPDSFFARFTRLLRREQIREIRCFECQAPQQVSSFAKSSLCSHCGSYIDLKDFKVTTAFNRSILTQGTVVVTSRGEISSSKVVCGEALIRGKLNGNLICTGTTRIKFKGRVLGGVETKQLTVEKGSAIEFVRPIKAATVQILGKASARIVADSVAISKTGVLEGTVYAKSITVDKGGIFHGELFIGKQRLEQSELLPTTAEPTGKGTLKLGKQGAGA